MEQVIITILVLLLVAVWAICLFLMVASKRRHSTLSITMQRDIDKKLDRWYDKVIRFFKNKPEDPMDYGC